ncbi:MAG: diaminopimelate decarboxylase [Nitrospirae bacterium]|nr:diaminopimelate decarboxylase [Candidatus Troglogloeales bacterium]
MNDFLYKKNRLYCGKVDIESIARAVGTPFYLYSAHTLKRHLSAYQNAFSSVPHLIAYAMKANANIALLRLLGKEGGGADILSGGELNRALRAEIDPAKIVFAGVGKTREEMREALRAGILLFNVESKQELIVLNEVAKSLRVKAPVAMRVNPEVNPKTHPYLSTGLKKSKFGIEHAQALSHYQLAARLANIDVLGIHSHIGSQLTDVKPFVEAVRKVSGLIQSLRAEGITIRYWDIGGGLGIEYNGELPPMPLELAKNLLPILKESGCTVILEPGRSIVGNAGILVTRVLYTKETEAKKFVVVDAGMNDLIRPSLYGAYHKIVPVVKKRRQNQIVDVVGPICESGDFLAQDRAMPQAAPEELLAVMSAGAYSFSMSSNYNARPRPPEILVHEESYSVIRERESVNDLIRGEKIPSYLQ